MAFTPVTVTGTVLNPDGSVAAGAIVNLRLSAAITDGVSEVVPTILAAACSNSGTFSIAGVVANDDSTTTPTGTYYDVRIYVAGVLTDHFGVIIGHASAPTVDIFSLARVNTAALPVLSYGINSVTAGDLSIVIGGTGSAPTVETGTLDKIATLHPPAAAVPLNAQKITGLANGSGAQDAAAFGQIPVLPNLTESRTFAITGAIGVPVGGTNYIPPFFEPVDSGVTKKLINVRYVIRAGTSVTFAVTRNGVNVSGLGALSASTVAGGTAPTVAPAVTDGDQFAIVISAVSGTPDGLTVSLIFETTL